MTNFLNMPNWEVSSVKQNAHDYRVNATYSVVPDRCPHCPVNLFAGKVYRHGTMEQEVMDLPSHGKRVGIALTRVRLRCQDCNKTFLQPIPDIDEGGRMTCRLVRYIEQQSLTKTFVSVADEVGVTEGTIRNVFREHVAHLDSSTVFATPERLGIDEVFLIGKARAVFTNLTERTMVGVLPDRLKRSVIRHLRTLSEPTVKLVAIDMCRAYRDAVGEVMPNAVVVVDKFHVLRLASVCLEDVRKSFRGGLEQKERRKLMHDRFVLLRRNRDLTDDQRATLATWRTTFPKLGRAYDIKEAFYDVWDAPNRFKAAEQFRTWEYGIEGDQIAAFQPLLTAWRNWEQEILAYFEHRETNAVTEALNGIARRIERDGRGYSFDVMRAKMLFGTKTQKRPPYDGAACASSGGAASQYAPEEIGDTYGSDVDSLLAELSATDSIPTVDTGSEEEED